MFGPIGGPEFLLILVLALLLFGPRKLPQIGRTVGKALAEFRSATNEFRSSLEREVDLERVRQDRSVLTEVRREIEQTVSGVPQATDEVPRALGPGAAAGDNGSGSGGEDGDSGGPAGARRA